MGEIVLEVGQLLVILNDLIFLNNERNQFALSITNFGPHKKNLKFIFSNMLSIKYITTNISMWVERIRFVVTSITPIRQKD